MAMNPRDVNDSYTTDVLTLLRRARILSIPFTLGIAFVSSAPLTKVTKVEIRSA
jgi:hypothetical protein